MSNNANTQANVKRAVPFLWVTNIQSSSEFYSKGLGIEKTNSWVDQGKVRWCGLELGGAAIMLQEFWTEGPHKNLPTDNLGVGTCLYFVCDNALQIYKELSSKGIEVSELFVGNNLWVVSLIDPDGYHISFESHTDVEEETNYSEWKGRQKEN